jgi:hypothetical protein
MAVTCQERMRTAALVIGLLGAAVVTCTERVPAADLSPSAIKPSAVTVTRDAAAPTLRRRVHRRAVVYKRTVGMPCILPPDVIVQRNWKGPQCRWIDNVIPGDERLWIKTRRYSLRYAGRW